MLCGIDEAGRGPLAGPVTAAAVILPKTFDISILRDSKKLSEKKREEIRKIIYKDDKVLWAIGWAYQFEIDRLNILKATFLAIKRAYNCLYNKLPVFCSKYSIEYKLPDVIIDGNLTTDISGCASVKAVPKADNSIAEVMAASILAKTARDKMMIRYSWLYPEYGFEKHKGYGTKKHIEAIKIYGESPIQRLSFSFKQ